MTSSHGHFCALGKTSMCALGKTSMVSRPMSVYGAYSATFAFAFCEQRLHEIGHSGKQLNPYLFYGHYSVNMVMTLNSTFHCVESRSRQVSHQR